VFNRRGRKEGAEYAEIYSLKTYEPDIQMILIFFKYLIITRKKNE